jgi:hypothetical protein
LNCDVGGEGALRLDPVGDGGDALVRRHRAGCQVSRGEAGLDRGGRGAAEEGVDLPRGAVHGEVGRAGDGGLGGVEQHRHGVSVDIVDAHEARADVGFDLEDPVLVDAVDLGQLRLRRIGDEVR